MKRSIEEVIGPIKKDFSGELTLKEGHKRRKFSAEFKRRFLSEANLNGVSA